MTGVVHLPEGTEMVMPGDNTEMRVELIQPIAMEEGLRFAIREGGRTVGAGRVTKIDQVVNPPRPGHRPGAASTAHNAEPAYGTKESKAHGGTKDPHPAQGL